LAAERTRPASSLTFCPPLANGWTVTALQPFHVADIGMLGASDGHILNDLKRHASFRRSGAIRAPKGLPLADIQDDLELAGVAARR
jgi:hypothetical protein